MVTTPSLIRPLTIGKLTFTNNLIQGPLAGVSCSPFRWLTWRYSQPAYIYSEMISAYSLALNNPLIPKRYLQIADGEGRICFQIEGHTARELAIATKKVTDAGAALVDFNCGCSVPKVRRNGAGSRLLQNLPQLALLLKVIRNSTPLPLSVKIRVAVENESANLAIAQVLNDAGVDCVVVHGRGWNESYGTPCRHDAIKFFVDELKVPVIGNGDIRDSASLTQMLTATGCAGAMIARAGVGQPWLIAQLAAELRGEQFTQPTLSEIGSLYLTHIERLIPIVGSEKVAILQARQLARGYARKLPTRGEFCSAINQCETFPKFNQLCQQHFGIISL